MQEIRSYRSTYGSEALAQGFMNKVYLWMTIGLCLTGAVSYYAIRSLPLMRFLFASGIWPFLALVAVELGLVFFLSRNILTLSTTAASGMFLVYSALNGLTLAPLFLVYTSESIASTFFVSAGMFGAMSLYGTVTKRDLTDAGSFFRMGLVGIIIASAVNFFLKSEMVMWVTTIIGIFVFLGLTAYDTQKLRELAAGTAENDGVHANLAVLGALTLYLDFINLFIMMLRIMGKRR